MWNTHLCLLQESLDLIFVVKVICVIPWLCCFFVFFFRGYVINTCLLKAHLQNVLLQNCCLCFLCLSSRQLNHYSASLFHRVASFGWKKRNCMFTHTHKSNPQPKFYSLLWFLSCSCCGIQHRLKKIVFFFFSPPLWFFLLSKASEPFSLKHKGCAAREANGSICTNSLPFFSLFHFFTLLWLTEERFKWYLILAVTAASACSR